jgi:cytochrome b561
LDTREKLSPLTIALHWIIAVGIIGLLAVGFYMSMYEAYGLYDLHKSIGICIFAVILVRVIWRIKNGWPAPVRDYPVWEHRLSRLTFWILILGSVLMPISGFIFSGAGGFGVEVFGVTLAPANPDPLDPTKVIPFNEMMSDMGHETHEFIGNLMAIALLLHISGALKHHLIDKDRTLLRMLGK